MEKGHKDAGFYFSNLYIHAFSLHPYLTLPYPFIGSNIHVICLKTDLSWRSDFKTSVHSIGLFQYQGCCTAKECSAN